MSPEKQRIAIAKACGWTRRPVAVSGRQRPQMLWFGPNGECNRESPANYPSDLNAMHEAEKSLPNKLWEKYCNNLVKVLDPECCAEDSYMIVISATAAQRAEAFLRTIGRWES